MKKANQICAFIGMVFSCIVFFYTFTFKKFKNVPVGPEFFPRVLSVALFICCLILFLTNLKETAENREKAPSLSIFNKGIQKALISLVIIVVYSFLWNITGFLLTTPFAIFSMIYILGKRNIKMMCVVSVGATVLIYLAFRILLGIEMPLGFLEDLF